MYYKIVIKKIYCMCGDKYLVFQNKSIVENYKIVIIMEILMNFKYYYIMFILC